MYDLEETLADRMINIKERGGALGGVLGRGSALTLNFLSFFLLLEAGTLHCMVHIFNCLRRRTDDQKGGAKHLSSTREQNGSIESKHKRASTRVQNEPSSHNL